MCVEVQLIEFGDRVCRISAKRVSPRLEEVPLTKRMHMVFLHDGSPVYYSHLVTQHLNLTFPERWIGRGGHVQWPPRSPDLTHLRVSSVGMDETRSLKRKVNPKRRIGRSHYEQCCPPKATTLRRPQESYTCCCQES
jgi:hypothetical protein